MLCLCGLGMIRVRIPWISSGGWLCTECGLLARMDYRTGRRTVIGTRGGMGGGRQVQGRVPCDKCG